MWSGSLSSFGLCVPRKSIKKPVQVIDPANGPNSGFSRILNVDQQQEPSVQGQVSYISSPRSDRSSLLDKGPPYSPFCEPDIDPISLSPLGDNTFEFSAPKGRTIVYNADSISKYFLFTGSLVDPVCRVEWSRSDVNRLQLALLEYKSEMHSESALFADIYLKTIELKNGLSLKQNLLSLEHCLGELVSELLKIIEGKSDTESAELEILLLLSQFEIPFAEMKKIDIEYSFHVWSSWILFLKGPKIKPTHDRENLLRTAVNLLECKIYIRQLNTFYFLNDIQFIL
jgi:hypothetical protein